MEDIFSKICRQHASWPINDITVGIEAARLFRAASIRRLRPFPQSVRLLEKLRGHPLGIVSNGQRVFSELELRQLGLYGYFSFVIFSSDFGFKKPDSRIFLAGAGHLGLMPHEILYIGDSWDNDIHPLSRPRHEGYAHRRGLEALRGGLRIKILNKEEYEDQRCEE